MDTIEYATFRYDTVEVENGLKWKQEKFVHMAQTHILLKYLYKKPFLTRT